MFEDRIAAMNAETEITQSAPVYEKRVYTVDEIQDILGVSKTTAYNLVKSGAFHYVKVGSQFRISKKSFDRWLDEMDHLIKKGNTILVLKSPKTKRSVRKVFLPTTVAQMLVARKQQIDELKELFGDEYTDYNLVFCNSSGRPMEGQVITHALKKLIRENDLPDVVFHSFRHASITYKLKWNGGDVKSVQGDSGHARAEMVSNVYSHIIDEDRRFNAQRFEERFYQGNTPEADTIPPMPKFESSTELPEAVPIESDKKDETATDTQADTELITKLLSNPETAALLKALASKL